MTIQPTEYMSLSEQESRIWDNRREQPHPPTPRNLLAEKDKDVES